jgi:hypothetical protein
MAQPTQLQFPFGGGLDQKTAEQYLDPNQRQIQAINGDFKHVGAFEKRLGVAHLLQAQPPIAQKCFSWSKSNLSVVSGASLQEYAPGANVLNTVGPLPPGKTIQRPVPAPNAGGAPELCDFPSPDGSSTWRVVLYQVVVGSEIVTKSIIIDANSGDILQEPMFIAQGNPLGGQYAISNIFYQGLGAVNQQVRLFMLDGSTGIKYAYMLQTTPTLQWVPFGQIDTLDHGGVGHFSQGDAVPFTGDPRGGIVHVYQFAPSQIAWSYWVPGASSYTKITSGSYTIAGTLYYPIYCVATYGPRVGTTGGEHVWFTFTTVNGGMYSYWYVQLSGDGNFVDELGGPRNIANTGTVFAETTGLARLSADFFFYSSWTAINPPSSQAAQSGSGSWVTYDNNGAVVGAGSTPYGYWPVARPFVNVDGNLYQPMYLNLYTSLADAPSDVNSQQVTLYLMQFRGLYQVHTDFTNCLPCSTALPRIVQQASQDALELEGLGRLPFTSGGAALLSSSGLLRWGLGAQTAGADDSSFGPIIGSTFTVDYFFDVESENDLYQTSELGQELSVSGSVPFCSDAASTFEDSFFFYPEFSYISLDGNTATFVGSYSYAVCYIYSDSAGLLHRSVPFFMGTVSPINGEAINLHILGYSATWRDLVQPATVYAEIYRTTDMGSTFFLLDIIPISSQGTPYVLYGPDSRDDQDLQVSSILYTTGGVLDNPNPPGSNFQIAHVSRKFLVDVTLRRVWYTQAFIDGLAPSYNEVLTQEFPDGGDITAIESMDSHFICFKQKQIFVMDGTNGPTQTGAGSDFTQPYRVSSDVGCVSWQSVVLVPNGLMFMAENGIYLLDRGLQVNFVGTVVQDLTTEFPTCTSAVLVPELNHVRFSLTNAFGATVVLIYDYLLSQWTTYLYPYFQAAIISACRTFQVPTRYTLLTLDGHLWQEHLPTDSNAYLDADTSGTDHWVQMLGQTAWVKYQIQAYQQCRWVQFYGIQLSNCGLQMDLAVNYVDAPVQNSTWLDTQLAALPIPGQVQFYVDRRYNSQMALSASVFDTPPSNGVLGTGQGMRFVNLSFDVNQLGTMYPQVAVGGRR